MKRVCTLRKVLSFSLKGPLRKVILLFLYIVWFFMTTKFLLFLNVVAFYRHSVLIVFTISPARRYAMEWKGNPKYLHEKKFFLIFIATFATRILTCWYTTIWW